jgi:hypothetical protein
MAVVHKGGVFDLHNYRVMSDGTVRSA